jgi:hypothetical protein
MKANAVPEENRRRTNRRSKIECVVKITFTCSTFSEITDYNILFAFTLECKCSTSCLSNETGSWYETKILLGEFEFQGEKKWFEN